MIEKILERLSVKCAEWFQIWKAKKDDAYADGKNDGFIEAFEIVQEVAKEYEGRTCENCKYEKIRGDFEPCCVCRNAYSDDCFEPKDAPYQKGE